MNFTRALDIVPISSNLLLTKGSDTVCTSRKGKDSEQSIIVTLSDKMDLYRPDFHRKVFRFKSLVTFDKRLGVLLSRVNRQQQDRQLSPVRASSTTTVTEGTMAELRNAI